MELRQMEYFLALCQNLNFTLASQKLGITQPALSIQIKLLEEDLGTKLFDRIGKKLMITEAGMILRDGCLVIFSNLENVRSKIIELQQGEGGHLKIGALAGDVNNIVAPLLADFHTKFPKVQLSLIGSEEIDQLVLQNEIDIGITISPVDDERLTAIPLYKEDLLLVVSNQHDLAKCVDIDFERLKDIPIILFRPDHQCRRLLDNMAYTMGFIFRPRIETTTVESIMKLLKDGTKASILPGTLALPFANDSIKFLKIKDPTPNRQIEIVYRRDKFLGFATREFIDIILKYTEQLESNMRDIISIPNRGGSDDLFSSGG